MGAPAWAERIVLDYARFRHRRLPTLTWRWTRYQRSSGRATHYQDGGDNVHVSAGRDPVDQRLVLCHELAHWDGPEDQGHTLEFWVRAWRLYRRYRVPTHYALAREGKFARALESYRRLDGRRAKP